MEPIPLQGLLKIFTAKNTVPDAYVAGFPVHCHDPAAS
jgi:hypothetical protein